MSDTSASSSVQYSIDRTHHAIAGIMQCNNNATYDVNSKFTYCGNETKN